MLAKSLQQAAFNGIQTTQAAEAIDFDGTNDYLSRASLSVSGTGYTFSAWVYPATAATNGTLFSLGIASNDYFVIDFSTDPRAIRVLRRTAGGTVWTATFSPNTVRMVRDSFYHIVISGRTNSNIVNCAVNDVVSTTTTYSVFTATGLNTGQADVGRAYPGSGGASFIGRLANVYLDYTYRDLSVEANRRLFITADRKPVPKADLAALNPILYLPMDDPTQPGLNLGTGGDFNLTGVIARSGRGPNQYNTPYSDLDGTADYLSMTTAPTGIADGKQFTFSCEFNIDSASNTPYFFHIASSGNNRLSIGIDTTNNLFFRATNAAGTEILLFSSSTVFYAGRNYALQISLDLSDVNKRSVYVNGQAISGTWTKYANDSIDFTTTTYAIGRNASGATNYLNGRLGDVFFHTSYIDLSVPANLAKFVTGTGIDAKPADLGANGELPFGTAPLIYLPMYGNDAGKNYGTGGDFTVNSGPYTGARGPNEYWGNKAQINSTAYLSKASTNLGLTNTKTFSFVCWIGGLSTGTDFIPLSASGASIMFHKQNQDNKLRIYGGGLDVWTNSTYTSSLGCVMVSVDLTNSALRSFYIDGTPASVTWNTYTNTAWSWSTLQTWSVLQRSGYGSGTGWASELYFTTDYIDFSQEANRLKFRDAFGNPTNLPALIEAGEVPNPAIYMRFDPASFGKNSGTGGDFTVNGTITDAGQL